jgi:hypothetical protein
MDALGVRYTGLINELHLTNYDIVPPKVDKSREYRLLVPVSDRDGNDLGGVRTPDMTVPLGTHLSWNPRDVGFAPGQLCVGQGSYIPFAAQRPQSGDPRASLQDRYPDKATYVRKVTDAARSLVSSRLMLDEDVDRWTQRASKATGW